MNAPLVLTQDIEAAYQYCERLTKSHYENFPVASVLLPKKIRRHVYPIYAFARHADDLADELQDIVALEAWKTEFDRSFKEEPDNPILIALQHTLTNCNLPKEPFDNLLSAFRQDLDQNRYHNWDDLLSYCQRSANPVGRIILMLNNIYDESSFEASDDICTALQLTNFWQDVLVDIEKNRIYIPQDLCDQYKVTEIEILNKSTGPHFQDLVKELVESTRFLFFRGMPLLDTLPGRLRWELKLTVSGGLAILKKIENLKFDVLSKRPVLTRLDWVSLFARFIVNRGPSK